MPAQLWGGKSTKHYNIATIIGKHLGLISVWLIISSNRVMKDEYVATYAWFC